MTGPSGRYASVKRSSRGTGRCSTSPAPTRRRPSNQPRDSLRHSVLTRPHAGVCRKLTDRWARTNAICSAALIGLTTGFRAAGRIGSLEGLKDMPPVNAAGCCPGVCDSRYADDMSPPGGSLSGSGRHQPVAAGMSSARPWVWTSGGYLHISACRLSSGGVVCGAGVGASLPSASPGVSGAPGGTAAGPRCS